MAGTESEPSDGSMSKTLSEVWSPIAPEDQPQLGYGALPLGKRRSTRLQGVPEMDLLGQVGYDLEAISNHTEEEPEELEELKCTYRHFTAGDVWYMQFLNDVLLFVPHILRALDEEGLQRGLANDHEKAYLKRYLGLDLQPQLLNMMAFRRSNMKVVLVIMLVSTWHLAYVTFSDWLLAYAEWSRPFMETDRVAWELQQEQQGLPRAFTDYSVAIAAEVQRQMTGNANFMVAMGNSVNALLALVGVGCTFVAMWNWVNFRRSRKMLLAAWVFAVCGPFVSSIVPARLFVDWRRGEEITKTYTNELLEVSQFNDKMAQLRKGCFVVMTDEGEMKVNSIENTVERICSIVEKHLPDGNVSIPTSITFTRWKRVDFSFSHSSCKQARRLIESELSQSALTQLKVGCQGINSALGDGMMSLNEEKVEEVATQLAKWMGYAAETAICLMLSLSGFMTLFPVALSVAPGMLKGALRMKMLVPQSNIPGMFVLMLPWMYGPVAWCYYSVFFQILGGVTLLLGLLIIALHPIGYSILGMRWGLSDPLTDDQVLKVVKSLNSTVLSTIILGVVFIIVYLISMLSDYAADKEYWGMWGNQTLSIDDDDWAAKTERELWSSIIAKSDRSAIVGNVVNKVALILLAVLQKYFLTAIAGFDWMMGQAVQFRIGEADVNGQLNSKSLKISKEYASRIDQLVALEWSKRKEEEDL